MRTKYLVAALAAVTTLSACAGREAHPVAVVQPQDNTTDCQSLVEEMAANQKQILNLDSQRANHNANNVVVGTIGLVLFAPALLALDTTDYEKQEMTALKERDDHLQRIYDDHKCTASASAS